MGIRVMDADGLRLNLVRLSFAISCELSTNCLLYLVGGDLGHNRKRKRLGDLVANTVVRQEKVREPEWDQLQTER